MTSKYRYQWSFKSMCHEYSSNHQWKLNYYTRVSYFREIINIYCLRAPTYICIWWRNKNQCLDVKNGHYMRMLVDSPDQRRKMTWMISIHNNDDRRDGAPITESRIQLWKKMSHIVLWGACHNSSLHASPVE